KKFRNIVDSGEVTVEKQVTCLVGKNEAGKSALLEALYLFNPAYDETFNVGAQYPRWLAVNDRRSGDLNDVAPISVRLELEDHERDEVVEALGAGVLTSRDLEVEKRYGGRTCWAVDWSEEAAVKNLLALDEFPQSVADAVKDQITLDGLREALEELAPTDEGSGPSGEEIGAASAVLADKGLDGTGVQGRLVGILEPHLPKFFRFTEYSTLPGRIDFKKLATGQQEGPGRSGLQTARALLQLAGTEPDQL
ncbi:MAG: hypothetical protein OXF44_10200, partial [Anaerolineaceae bacterium]|nr:hypothetical protein [Anaerolineaceae bacterium]